jgi:hypothetical protein
MQKKNFNVIEFNNIKKFGFIQMISLIGNTNIKKLKKID